LCQYFGPYQPAINSTKVEGDYSFVQFPLVFVSFNLTEYYIGENGRDFICSNVDDNGLTKCSEIPLYVDHGRRCNLSATDVASVNHVLSAFPAQPPATNVSLSTAFSASIASASAGALHVQSTTGSGSCINWNQYYTSCRPAGSNPFQGAISFDNIGLAWVAIFQVIGRPLTRPGRTKITVWGCSVLCGRPPNFLFKTSVAPQKNNDVL
jgi:hypothetical protein